MLLFLIFVVANIAISYFLEVKRWRVANIAHAVLTAFLLTALAFSVSDGFFAESLNNIFGEDVYRSLHNVFAVESGGGLFTPLLLIQVVTFLLSVFAVIVSAKSVGWLLARSGKSLRHRQVRQFRKVSTTGVNIVTHLFKINCVMRC